MFKVKESFIINERGEKTKVVLDMEDYKKILADLEELESIRAYDEAKESHETPIPFEEAVRDIFRTSSWMLPILYLFFLE